MRKNITLISALFVFLLIQNFALGYNVISECPESDIAIEEDTLLDFDEPCEISEHEHPDVDPGAISIERDNIELNCNGSKIIGDFDTQPDDVFRLGIHSNERENIKIKNCVIENYGDGILILDSKNFTLVNNTLINNFNGVVIDNSMDSIIENNEFRSDGRGILFLPFSQNNTIRNNIVNSPQSSGFEVEGSYNNTIYNNTIETPEKHDFRNKGIWMRVPKDTNEVHSNNLIGDAEVYYGDYEDRDSYAVHFSNLDPVPQNLVIETDLELGELRKAITPVDVLYLPEGNYDLRFYADEYIEEDRSLELNETVELSSELTHHSEENDVNDEDDIEEKETEDDDYFIYFLISIIIILLIFIVKSHYNSKKDQSK